MVWRLPRRLQAVPDWLAEFLQAPEPVLLGVVALVAWIEYFLPMFPSDVIVAASVLAVASGNTRYGALWAAASFGGTAGALLQYGLGRWAWHGFGDALAARLGPARVEAFAERMRRSGPWILLLNRAMPAVRSVSFLAAGLARFSPWTVAVLAVVANGLWVLLLLWLGQLVKGQWSRIEALLVRYSQGVAIAAAAAVAVYILARYCKGKARGRRG